MSMLAKSLVDTRKIAENFAAGINKTALTIVAYTGNLGAGKTTFTRFLAENLGYRGEVTSPTFTIVNEYQGGQIPIFHFDMYRIEDCDSLSSTGFFEFLQAPALILIEWSENVAEYLPCDFIKINFEYVDENSRNITIFSHKNQEIFNENSSD